MVRCCGAVEHVAGDEDGIDAVLLCPRRDALYRLEPLLAEESRGVTFDRAEGLAELPICRVENSDRQLLTCAPVR